MTWIERDSQALVGKHDLADLGEIIITFGCDFEAIYNYPCWREGALWQCLNELNADSTTLLVARRMGPLLIFGVADEYGKSPGYIAGTFVNSQGGCGRFEWYEPEVVNEDHRIKWLIDLGKKN